MREKVSASDGRVALRRCESYERGQVRAAVDAAVDDLGGWSTLIQSGQRVLVKPNFLAARPSADAVVTHFEVVAAVCEAVLDAGATPVVGDSTPIGSVVRVARVSGTTERLKGLGVEVMDLDKGEKRPATIARELGQIKLDPRVFEFDRVINVPKLKAHTQCVMTGSVKNLFGCAPGRTKAFWHFKAGKGVSYGTPGAEMTSFAEDAFSRMLVETYQMVAPALNVMDAVEAMQGQGPMNGTPRNVACLAASRDGVALDRVMAEIIGLGDGEVPALAAARALGIGTSELAHISLLGDPIEEFRLTDFQQAVLMPVQFRPSHIVKGYFRQAWARWSGTAPTRSAMQ